MNADDWTVDLGDVRLRIWGQGPLLIGGTAWCLWA